MRPMNALDSHFVNSIKARGPMSVAVWMKDCLTYPRFGYYTKAASPANVLGRTGDFVTSVEMSPVFCGMVGVWARHALIQLGSPKEALYVELGPGSGKLSSSVLQALKKDCDVEVHLVEASESMRQSQRDALKDARVFWHDSVRNLVSTLKERSTPVIAVAHEYFDALPVYRFQFSEQRGWCEELVDISRAPLDAESQDVSPLPLRLVLSPGPTPPAMVCLGPSPPAQVGGRVEVSPDSQSDMQQLARLLKQGGGAALVVDYGQWGPAANSLRAIVEHKFVEPMEQPAGEADLSVDVDFRYISNAARKEGAHTAFLTQRDFLRKTGVEVLLVNQLKKCATEEEAEELISQYNRIVDEMGEVYKVLMVSSDVSVIKDFQ